MCATLIIILRLSVVFAIAALKLVLILTYLRIYVNSLSICNGSRSLLIYNDPSAGTLVGSATFALDILASVRLVRLLSVAALIHSYSSLAYFLCIDVVYILICNIFVHAHFWIRQATVFPWS